MNKWTVQRALHPVHIDFIQKTVLISHLYYRNYLFSEVSFIAVLLEDVAVLLVCMCTYDNQAFNVTEMTAELECRHFGGYDTWLYEINLFLKMPSPQLLSPKNDWSSICDWLFAIQGRKTLLRQHAATFDWLFWSIPAATEWITLYIHAIICIVVCSYHLFDVILTWLVQFTSSNVFLFTLLLHHSGCKLLCDACISHLPVSLMGNSLISNP